MTQFKGYDFQPQPDGSLTVLRAPDDQGCLTGCFGFAFFAGGTIIGTLMSIPFPTEYHHHVYYQSNWQFAWFPFLFGLFGLSLFVTGCFQQFGKETWRLTPNRFEIETRLWGYRSRTVLTDGEFTISAQGMVYSHRVGSMWGGRLLMPGTGRTRTELLVPQQFTSALAEVTGWKITYQGAGQFQSSETPPPGSLQHLKYWTEVSGANSGSGTNAPVSASVEPATGNAVGFAAPSISAGVPPVIEPVSAAGAVAVSSAPTAVPALDLSAVRPWVKEELPDGGVRLVAWGPDGMIARVLRLGAYLLPVGLLGHFAWMMAGRPGAMFAIPPAMIAVGKWLWDTFQRVELWVWAGRTERRRIVFGWTRIEAFDHGQFRLWIYDSSGKSPRHSYNLDLKVGYDNYSIADSEGGTFSWRITSREQVRALGQLLARITGWPLQISEPWLREEADETGRLLGAPNSERPSV